MSATATPARRSGRVGRHQESTVVRLGLLMVIGLAAGWVGYALAKQHDPELAKAIATGAVTLFFGVLIGGAAQVLYADLELGRAMRGEKAEFIRGSLGDLKAVY